MVATRGLRKRAPAALVVTVAALAAGGCGVASSGPTTNFQIPNMTSQKLMHQLEQPTSRGPSGYPVLSGPESLSLLGIQYTTQGNDALHTWLNGPSGNHAAYQQAGRNLATAFPQHKAEIDSKLGQ